jgi:hypothetical protein
MPSPPSPTTTPSTQKQRYISLLRWPSSAAEANRPPASLPDISHDSSTAGNGAHALADGRPVHLTADGAAVLCRVCLVNLTPKSRVSQFACGHCFHSKCVGEVHPPNRPFPHLGARGLIRFSRWRVRFVECKVNHQPTNAKQSSKNSFLRQRIRRRRRTIVPPSTQSGESPRRHRSRSNRRFHRPPSSL